MIKNIVFDVGNVLVHFRWYEYMLDLGISAENAGFLGENMVLTDFWDRMDLGIEDEDKACAYFSEKYPQLKKEIELFWSNMQEIVREYDYSLPLIKELKGMGFSVYLLSNYPPKMAELHWPHFKFRAVVDGEIISGKEKVAKPDHRIYELLCERYGLEKTECLFVDDRKKNVDAAESFGMQGFLFAGKDGREAPDLLKEKIAEIRSEKYA